MLKIYNTLTRQKEEFKPIDEKAVRMYSCGPTVYSFAHIGNMRTYIFMDIFRRTLKYDGYKIKGVMNITDVGHLLSDGDDGEDKMEKASREQKKTPWEIAAFYTDVFFKDLAKLNIGRPEIIAKATEHIAEMIELIKKLEANGHTYMADGNLYYDISISSGFRSNSVVMLSSSFWLSIASLLKTQPLITTVFVSQSSLPSTFGFEPALAAKSTIGLAKLT